MSPRSRRRLLQIGGTALTSGLAGCLGALQDSSGSQTTELAELSIQNEDTRSHTVHVLVLQDREPVYWDSQPVAAGSVEDGSQSSFEQVGTASFQGFPTELQECVLCARVDDQPLSERNRRDLSNYDVSCLQLVFTLEPNDRAAGTTLSILEGTDPELCENV